MTNTMFLLMAQYGTVEIPLESLCEMLGSKPATIYADAARRRLPFPAHKLGSQKAKWFVHVADLAAHIDAKREAAKADWNKLNAA